jgi:hypothetical protein
MRGMSARLLLELVSAVVSLTLLFVTLAWRDWIEVIFGFDPDHGRGSLEWGVVLGLLAITLGFSVVARLEWQRTVARAESAEARLR